ncbi:MAG TPA: hypothetical protein VGE55_04580 [Limnobacter sp.]|uniref:hypothetical protein n=1 Tax=Limnobacter sp. TaxID=2003368 RepID=UPI002EDB241E
MIGWWIVVSTHTPQERDQADQDTKMAATLAQWEAGADGICWIERLAEQGKAAKLSGNGYPNRYTAKACDVLPLLDAASPTDGGTLIIGDDYVMPSNWRGKIELYDERIAACRADHVLTIDAWDQS